MTENNRPVASPCVSICVLDEDDICTGCYRSAEEISQWVLLDNEQRIEVLHLAQARRRRVNPFA